MVRVVVGHVDAPVDARDLPCAQFGDRGGPLGVLRSQHSVGIPGRDPRCASEFRLQPGPSDAQEAVADGQFAGAVVLLAQGDPELLLEQPRCSVDHEQASARANVLH